jgi:23S rRNA (uridine2552-2'-O)-methyltransferase
MADKSGSSKRWLREHFTDPYVKKAQQEGYRSRAVYKLQEINERDRLFKPGMTVVDLGAAPGGWAQLLVKLVKPKGRVIALDILPMDPIEGVEFILGDFSEDSVAEDLLTRLSGVKVDWVLSDISPNMSGNDSIDMPRHLYLAELALDFALKILPPEGGILFKLFQGAGFDEYLGVIKKKFLKTTIRKPKASRSRSKEVYILARTRRPG